MEATPARPGFSGSRAFSGIELLLGALIVIGHNVYQVVPNEVPILFVLGLVSVRLRDGGWSAIGFTRPGTGSVPSWGRIVLIAMAAAAVRILLGAIVIEPITAMIWPQPIVAPEGMNEIAGNAMAALQWLLLIWTFAAFGEEIAYRGYLTLRGADLGRRSATAFMLATLFASILFGYGHYYKGPAGVVDSGFAGLVLGTAYLMTGRCLWTSILAHGFIDTIGLIAVYFGLAN
ncbi:MAG TPA: CPBP family intramembrane glutamic endopeptidase [Patescibacteria group bacterium]|nr:CPBP family intramembrane glutamic endopeptidase [Patescibacteria group bacterium]